MSVNGANGSRGRGAGVPPNADGPNMTPLIAQHTGILASAGYAAIAVLVLVAMLAATSILVITHVMPKAKRQGAVKDGTYESGMEVIGDARRRFNVKFYLVAMLFLLFDVELVFMYPWARVFADGARQVKTAEGSTLASLSESQQFLFAEMGVFFAILLVGYGYAWRKGVFRWD